jgi:hypothetical protein
MVLIDSKTKIIPLTIDVVATYEKIKSVQTYGHRRLSTVA